MLLINCFILCIFVCIVFIWYCNFIYMWNISFGWSIIYPPLFDPWCFNWNFVICNHIMLSHLNCNISSNFKNKTRTRIICSYNTRWRRKQIIYVKQLNLNWSIENLFSIFVFSFFHHMFFLNFVFQVVLFLIVYWSNIFCVF
jgi:hypothetical protein